MHLHLRATSLLPVVVAAVMASACAAASAHGWRGGHRGWGVGIGLSVPLIVVPARSGVAPPAAPVAMPDPAPPARPEPVFRAAAGADATRLEADRRACDREAMAQPAAMADARVFHQTALACMGVRGWTRAD